MRGNMRTMKTWIALILCIAILASVAIGCRQCIQEEPFDEGGESTGFVDTLQVPPIFDGTGAEPDTEYATVPGLDVEELTRDPSAETEDVSLETGRKPVIDLEDGKEVYLDSSVILLLSQAEAAGDEDRVNAVLDWILLLVDRFSEMDYEIEAVRQVQRLFYLYREPCMTQDFDTVAEKLARCIPSGGASREGFSETVSDVFGSAYDLPVSFVFDGEVRT